MQPVIGVVTITYNSGDVIRPFMACCLRQTWPDFILYIIDNASKDDTAKQISDYADPRIRLILNADNVGVAAGNNQGIRMALADSCTHIMLLNNDVEFEDTLFARLLNRLQERGFSLIAPKMMYDFDRSLIWYAGSFFDRKSGYMISHRGMMEMDKGQYDLEEVVDYAPTCCVLMKKEVVEDIGMMDEAYFAYFDDTDFFYRIYKDGRHKVCYFPPIRFYHKVGALSRSRSGSPQQFRFGNFHIRLSTRNRVYYLRKQKSFLACINIVWFYIRKDLRFLFSGKYHRNFLTWKLLQKSFWEGMRMPLR
jgi:GT2 family glycosyltransferase